VFEPRRAPVDGDGVREDLVVKPSVRHLRSVQVDTVPMEEQLVPLNELLAWETEASDHRSDAVGRLAALLCVAAIAVAMMLTLLAASTEVTSVFSELPSS
jgi:hypothetical protein